jgi:hypothetical protein
MTQNVTAEYVETGKTWFLSEGRVKALFLGGMASLPMLACYLYGIAAYRPGVCRVPGSFGSGCVSMGPATRAFPDAWMGPLLFGFVIMLAATAVFVALPKAKVATLAFTAGCVLCGGIALVHLVTAFTVPNPAALLAQNAWVWVPAVVAITTAFAGWNANR